MNQVLTLYDYYRSSCSYRVRIALNVKGVAFERVNINLATAEQSQQPYGAINPQALVPTLRVGDRLISQSLGIVEWLEEHYPEPALLPADSGERARVRALAYAVAMDMQPLNNLRVLNYFRDQCGWDDAAVNNWYQHWIDTGFRGIETQLKQLGCDGRYCFGDSISLADVCLIPQVYNARRFHCDLSPYPLIRSVDSHCTGMPAFATAAPEALLPG